MPARDVLEAATLGGARALGIAERAGSIEPGKRADLIALDLDAPTMQPLHDVFAQLVHAAAAPRVTHTFVDGQCLYADGEWKTLDVAEILRRAQLWRERLNAA